MKQILLFSGPYGVGKTTLARAYEQRGFRAITNVPPRLVSALVQEAGEGSRIVLTSPLDEAAEEARKLLAAACAKFDSTSSNVAEHPTARFYASFFVRNDPRYRAIVYADLAKNHDEPLGYVIVDMTFFIPIAP